MHLRDQLLLEHSKANCQLIVQWVGRSPERFEALLELFFTDEHRVVQRAAWPLSYIAAANPELVKKHTGRFLRYLQQPGVHDAVKRNTLRFLQTMDIPARYHGKLMDICFRYINGPTEKAAIKAFSLTILDRLSVQYPDIRPELLTIIEDRWPYEMAAFHSRARKIAGKKKK